ncbi:hypothetical protein QTO01_15255 [Vibrio mytili]|uniref:hypothetical protein n=1 Tax=Vibrio mytili TaxID=50718 RepID=UPI002F3E3ADA
MKAFFVNSYKWIEIFCKWSFHHKTHAESWRKAGVFFLTVGAITFLQLTLVLMPMEKEGNFNLYEAERIEQIDIKKILEHECKLDSKAYTRCSVAKYHLNNVNVLLPIFVNVSIAALTLGLILLFLYLLTCLARKPEEFASWVAEHHKDTSKDTSLDEKLANKDDVQLQASNDS